MFPSFVSLLSQNTKFVFFHWKKKINFDPKTISTLFSAAAMFVLFWSNLLFVAWALIRLVQSDYRKLHRDNRQLHCDYRNVHCDYTKLHCDYRKLHCDYPKLRSDYTKLHCDLGLTAHALKWTNHSRLILLCILLYNIAQTWFLCISFKE